MDNRIQTVCLLLLSAVAMGTALYWLRSVMIPFVLALVIALGLSALVDFQREWLRIPRSLTILSTLVLATLTFVALGLLLSASLTQFAANASAYNEQLRALVDRVFAALPPEVGRMTELRELGSFPATALGSLLVQTTNAVTSLLSQSALVLIFVLFLVLGRKDDSEISSVWLEIERGVKGYLVTKVATSAITGFLVSIVLALLGIDLALVFGFFAFVLNFIPNVGSIVATLLPLPVVLMSADVSPTAAVLAIALPATVQFAIGNVVEPKMMGRSLDLHPVTVLLALMLWGTIWGVVGMLLATPITASLKIVLERLEPARPLANLLAGRMRTVG